MMTHNHQTAPTRFVEANGIRFAYRRFGEPGGVPHVRKDGNHYRWIPLPYTNDATKY